MSRALLFIAVIGMVFFYFKGEQERMKEEIKTNEIYKHADTGVYSFQCPVNKEGIILENLTDTAQCSCGRTWSIWLDPSDMSYIAKGVK